MAMGLMLFYVLFPGVIIYLCLRFPLLDKIGMVILCYAVGLLLGNSGILPQTVTGIQNILCEVTVALSLPLLLFSLDMRQWVGLAGKTILSLCLAIISITAISLAGFFWLPGVGNWKLVGMAVSVYTGGTPNLAAMKTGLSVDPDLYLAFHTYDIFVSLLCIVFFITVAQRVFLVFLPRFQGTGPSTKDMALEEESQSYRQILTPRTVKGLVLALVLSAAIVGMSIGLSGLAPKSQSTAVTILMITTLGLGASFIAPVRAIDKSFQLGMYLIMIFCLTVSSMADLRQLADINLPLLGYILTCVFGSLFLHALLCRLFKIDTDTFIITAASAICSPPFVPVVAAALKNRAVIISGLTTGIIGYALGNYLGITMAYMAKSFIN
jgi:uncharacterized membrane protein